MMHFDHHAPVQGVKKKTVSSGGLKHGQTVAGPYTDLPQIKVHSGTQAHF